MTTKKKIDKAYAGKLSKAKTLIIQSIVNSADGLNLTTSDIDEIMGDWSKDELEVGYHYFKELVENYRFWRRVRLITLSIIGGIIVTLIYVKFNQNKIEFYKKGVSKTLDAMCEYCKDYGELPIKNVYADGHTDWLVVNLQTAIPESALNKTFVDVATENII